MKKYSYQALISAILVLFMAVTFPAFSAGQKTLIIYFSQPETVAPGDVDGFSGASVIEKNNQQMGSTEYLATLIQQQTGGDLFRIETTTPYPREHQPLLDAAQKESRENARPIIKTALPDLSGYQTIFVGYPIWWYKMPMVMYSLFEQNQFSGKTLIPFTSHGGSRFTGSIQEIKRLQPNANVITQGLAVYRTEVADEQTIQQVKQWVNQLNMGY
ncbi:flavodoxin [Mangrovibacter sp. MFB070]|uniref:flavodoxin n=1 Tax=Mangrovibacter sp. MFB070 TaxID=1224318 RepID=UPI0004D5D671|nr:flavodoxin [Mangrovibacter sp. MFB070]KEA51074.1 flavodoxin [Mangrovibacter sp. MFB070]